MPADCDDVTHHIDHQKMQSELEGWGMGPQ
jgi:hypothetical protein